MKKRIFPLIIALSALAVSASAAFYSVFGLSKLFAGASTQVIIMAGSLEFAKLVVASLLYQYWGTINKFLRTYLLLACFILMVITSGGIYGFLSGAYQSTANKSELLDKSLIILNQKQTRFEETKGDLTIEKTQLTKSISDLRIALSNPTQIQYIDKESGTLITTSSSSARRALQSELKSTISDRDGVNLKIEAILDSINKTDIVLLDKEISNESESELGPLKYLSETTGYPMGQVVNWFLLLIVFVFDPLAIALVVASNMAFAQIRKPKEEDYFITRNKHLEVMVGKKEQKEVMIEKKDLIMDDMEEVKKYPTTEDIIKFNLEEPIVEHDGMRYNPEKPEETLEEQMPLDFLISDEKRMDVIGQNGNDGLHYDKIEPSNKDLSKLDPHHNLKFYNDELYYEGEGYDGELDRLTDTTQTLIVDKEEEEENEKRTLKYRKR